MIDEKKLLEEIEGGKLQFDIDFPQTHTETALKVAKATCKIICDAIRNQPKVGEWISCEKRMPEELKTVIACTKSAVFAGCYLKGKWYRENMFAYDSAVVENDVIKWQPLPKLPEY